MAYPDWLTGPMRKELTDLGARELRSAGEVDALVAEPGVTMVVVNSVCGCAAGKARPGIAQALEHANRPDRVGTVFAGADMDATDRARSYFAPFPPSSPSIGLLRGGKLLYLMERKDIEASSAERIAAQLTLAFDEHCTPATAQ
ncbi:MAG: BrxA/BrxB family bacilliredoxin [Acidobacteriota bacterium]|nr:BrxA/BrxB family bacilliredoxin [Acidobacteriota bacterium]